MSQDMFSDSQIFEDNDEEVVNGGGDDTEVDADELAEELNVPFSQMPSQPPPPSASGRRNSRRLNGHQKDQSLLKTNQTADEIARHQSVFVDIARETREADKCADIREATTRLTEQLAKQDECFLSGGVNENMPLDAQCIVINSALTVQLAKRLQTDAKQFDAMEFAEKLLTALDPLHRMDADETTDGRGGVDRTDWVEFGRKYCRLHRVLPPFVYIKGAFNTDGEPEKPPPKARVRHQKPVLGAQTGATQLDMKDKVNADVEATPEEVEQILKTIQKLEAKNPDIPALPYLEVMANPKSMSETVENIFHSSFLVKDGLARLVADPDDGAPGFQSVENAGVDGVAAAESEAGIQSVFSFSMADWRLWVKHYGIRKAAIKHTKKSAKSPAK